MILKRLVFPLISGDGNTTPTGLVAGRSHFVLNELAKRHWCSFSGVFFWHPGHVHRTERWLWRCRPARRGGRGRNAGGRCTSGDVRIRRSNQRGFLSLLHGLKLQSGVLDFASGLGELLSRLRQFFGQVSRHFGDLLGDLFCHMIPKPSELHLNFRVDAVQFVVEVAVPHLGAAELNLFDIPYSRSTTSRWPPLEAACNAVRPPPY